MSLITCLEVSRLLESRAAGLASAEAIRVEQHLHGCAQCRETDDYLQAFGLLAGAVPKLDQRRSERALGVALATLELNRPVPIPRPTHRGPTDLRRLAAFGAGAATMVTAIVLFFAGNLPEPRAMTPASSTRHEGITLAGHLSTAVFASVVEGRLGALGAGQPLPGYDTLRAEGPTELEVNLTPVSALAGTEVQWQPESLSLALLRGRLRVEAHPTQALTVTSGRYRIQSRDGSFELTPELVRAASGTVRVLDLDGTTLCELSTDETCALPVMGEQAPPLEATRGTLEARLTRPLSVPLRDETQLGLLNLALGSGDHARARALALKVDRRSSESAILLFTAANLLASSHPARAEALYRHTLSLQPDGHHRPEIARRLEILSKQATP